MNRINLTRRQSILLIFFIQNLLFLKKIFYSYSFVSFITSASSAPWRMELCPTDKEKVSCSRNAQKFEFLVHIKTRGKIQNSQMPDQISSISYL